jgi:hypothetical protein
MRERARSEGSGSRSRPPPPFGRAASRCARRAQVPSKRERRLEQPARHEGQATFLITHVVMHRRS